MLFDIYQTLKLYSYFIDNEFLLKYCQLIERNRRTPIRHNTNKHHIVPKSWYKLNSCKVNNESSNLVNLVYRDHVLAHYYLCLCTEDPLKYANELALICLESRKNLSSVDKQLLHNLPLYNIIYEDYCFKNKMNYKLYEEAKNDN